jgi:hypothetical protein
VKVNSLNLHQEKNLIKKIFKFVLDGKQAIFSNFIYLPTKLTGFYVILQKKWKSSSAQAFWLSS